MKNKTFDRIYSLKDLTLYLEHPRSTLVAFDVDFTLTHPNEPAFQFANFVKNKELVEEIFMSLDPKERDLFSNLMVFHLCGSSPIEPDSPQVLAHLQKEGYLTLALTASMTLPLNKECLIEKRVNNLKTLGFDFASSFPNLPSKKFDTLTPHFDCYPHFQEGVLISNGENQEIHKGDVLVSFLNLLDSKPHKIVMLDDRLHNLQVIHEALNDFDPKIEYIGLHYLGALKFPSKEVSKDEFRTKMLNLAQEAKTLFKHHQSSNLKEKK